MKTQTDSAHKKLELAVLARTDLGKRVKQMRKKGIIPANIYGAGIKPTAVSVNLKEFHTIHKQAGETGIVYLGLDGKDVPTLIRAVEYHPVDNSILHIDFRAINLKQKIETEVPVQVEGISLAMTQFGGVLLKQADHLMVEALPEKIPAHIVVDISTIEELGQEIKVSSLPVSSDYIIKEDPETVIVSVIEHKEESTEAQIERTETEITTGAPVEGAEGEEGAAAPGAAAPAPAEGEKKKEEKK